MAEPEASNCVLGVDLDGVCADFHAGLRPIAAEWLGVDPASLSPEPSTDYPEWNLGPAGGFDALYRYAVTRRELFANVPPIPDASLTLRRLWTEKRIRIRVITYRLYFQFFHQVAIRQTIEWLDRHDFPYWDLCFMKEKSAVGANLYIEDSFSNIQALRAAGKRVIAFRSSQNRQFDIDEPIADNWRDVEALVQREIEAWRQSRVHEQLPGD